MRIGQGFDLHAIGGDGPMRLLGVDLEAPYGLVGTSDGDVGAHAVADALLGAAAAGDIGDLFPSDAPASVNADSMMMLAEVAAHIEGLGFRITNVDVTLIIERVRIAPHRESMRLRLAEAMGIAVGSVSVQAKTADRLGVVGREDAVAALAVALIES